MKIPHGEFEECRTNPAKWVRKKLGLEPGGFAQRGYAVGLKDAICEYHNRNSVSQAHEALSFYLRKLTDESRKQAAHDDLDNYVVWAVSSNVIVASTRLRLSFPLGNGIFLGGDLTRLDVLSEAGRYRVVLLGDDLDVDDQAIRWPLIQEALADQFHRDATEVDVATQDLSGAALKSKCFSKEERQQALDAARELAEEISVALIAMT